MSNLTASLTFTHFYFFIVYSFFFFITSTRDRALDWSPCPAWRPQSTGQSRPAPPGWSSAWAPGSSSGSASPTQRTPRWRGEMNDPCDSNSSYLLSLYPSMSSYLNNDIIIKYSCLLSHSFLSVHKVARAQLVSINLHALQYNQAQVPINKSPNEFKAKKVQNSNKRTRFLNNQYESIFRSGLVPKTTASLVFLKLNFHHH